MKNRKDIDEQYKWDLEAIYSSNNDFEDDYNYVKSMIDELSLYENDMLLNSDNL